MSVHLLALSWTAVVSEKDQVGRRKDKEEEMRNKSARDM